MIYRLSLSLSNFCPLFGISSGSLHPAMWSASESQVLSTCFVHGHWTSRAAVTDSCIKAQTATLGHQLHSVWLFNHRRLDYVPVYLVYTGIFEQ